MFRPMVFTVVLGSLVACATDQEPATTNLDQASSVHLKGGKSAKPAFYDNGLTLSARGDLSGLGNADVLVTLDATAIPTASCTNPAGATQPPGQNPAHAGHVPAHAQGLSPRAQQTGQLGGRDAPVASLGSLLDPATGIP